MLAAGGAFVDRWLARHRRGWLVIGGALAVSTAISVALALPVVPVGSLHATPIVDINEDAVETVGWPRFVETVAGVWRRLPAEDRSNAVLFTGNYGEAGAIDRFGPSLGLPHAYSGHNSYARWRIPPASAGPVIVVGYRRQQFLDGVFADCAQAGRIDNGVDLDNEEQDGPIWVCRGPIRPWAELWPQLRHLSP
jgi:hypothetical protein